ncbi:MAG: ABC transporter substrate-binding protein [Clostridia bacterium]|nr:ABC transporter substrate-binding protein [Clostridia bacterium]
MKKLLSVILAAMLILSMAAVSCAEESACCADESACTLYYPSYMQETEGESLVLDRMPERIVCLSNAALQILVRCDIHPIAVTSLVANAEHPDWVYELPTITTGMNGMDIESIVAMEPDLLIVGNYQKEAYGEQLEAAGIPVYYTSEGPSIAYSQTREEAITLARSFGGDEMAKEITAEFEKVEARAQSYTSAHPVRSMLIFFYTPGSFLQTSEGYLGSILKQLPFENLADTVFDPSMRNVKTDTETIVKLNPEIIFAISPAADAEAVREQDEAAFAENPDLWNTMDAIAQGNIVYLGKDYVSSKGLQVIDSVNNLIDQLEAMDK